MTSWFHSNHEGWNHFCSKSELRSGPPPEKNASASSLTFKVDFWSLLLSLDDRALSSDLLSFPSWSSPSWPRQWRAAGGPSSRWSF